MLARPPRLSFALVLFLFLLAWSYLRFDRPASPRPILGEGQPTRADPLDFGIPLRFKDGVAKAPGENYTWSIVMPKMASEDIGWIQGKIPEAKLVVYEVDNTNAEYKIPKNKGREAMVSLCNLE